MGSVLVQFLYTSIVCYLGLTVGIILTWPSSTILLFSSSNTTLHRPMTAAEISLFGSLSSVGALISTPLVGYAMDYFGRRYCCIAGSLTHVIGWVMIVASSQVEAILVAVFLAGLGGAMFLTVPIFVGEFCQESIRGMMTSCSIIFYSSGMLISYVLGGYLDYKTNTYIYLTVAVLGAVTIVFVKESPVVLMQKGLEEEAAKSIAFFRGVKETSKEVIEEQAVISRALNPVMDDDILSDEEMTFKTDSKVNEVKKKLGVFEFFRKSQSTRKATYITLFLLSACYFQGIMVVYVYAEPLFMEAVPNMSPTICSVLLAVFTVVSGVITAYLVDLTGRKALMIWSSFGAGLCCVILGTQLQFKWGPHLMTVIVIYIYCALYCSGAGTIPYVFVAEVFLPEVKTVMSTLSIEWGWLCNFIVLFSFGPLSNAIGVGAVFYIFAAVCFATAAFCWFFMPETKGLTVDVIQELFLTGKRRKSLGH